MPRTQIHIELHSRLIAPILAALLALATGCSDSNEVSGEPDSVNDVSTSDADTSADANANTDADTEDAAAQPVESGCPSSDPDCVDWRFVTDEDGRALILHGLNIDGAAKHNAGLPTITDEEILQVAHEWGFNVARYLIFWSMTEPEQGVYDEAYLDAVEAYLDRLHEAGMWVVLDMHQDCWGDTIYELASGEETGGNNGAPMWATLTDGEPHNQPAGFWSLCYVSSDVIRAFDNFWDYEGHPELQDAYGAMWAHVAERFGEHPAVLGYDLMNEPWEGSNVGRQRVFDETLYHAFNERMLGAIRAVDNERWIFYEPRAFGPNQASPSYMPALTDPRGGAQKLAYFPHFYPVEYESGYNPANDSYIDRWESHRVNEMELQQAPLLSGEWSMLPFSSEADMVTYFERMHTMFDTSTSGWAFWDRGVTAAYFQGGVTEGLQVIDLLVRPYPRAVAGQPITYGFDESTRVFTLDFETRAKVLGTTDIFVPGQIYAEGWVLEVSSPEGTWDSEWNELTGVLSITTDPDIESHTIRIIPDDI